MAKRNGGETAFDHAYVMVFDPQPFLDLGLRGFAVPARQVEHPGGVTCRVLPFPCSANERFDRSFQYLEFVHLADLAVYSEVTNATRRKEGLFERSAERLLWPGFSLVTAQVDRQLQELQPLLAPYRPAVDHVNYRWQTEHEPHAPGWTYLKFREDILPFCELWFTQYDPDPQNPGRGRPSLSPHPNTCHEIVGCIWDLGGPQSELTARMLQLGEGEQRDDTLVLSDQFTIWPDAETPSTLGAGSFRAMVLACASLDTFKRLAAPDQVVTWRGQEAAILRPYPSGWAIVVIERPERG
jgi:hypothetical protein